MDGGRCSASTAERLAEHTTTTNDEDDSRRRRQQCWHWPLLVVSPSCSLLPPLPLSPSLLSWCSLPPLLLLSSPSSLSRRSLPPPRGRHQKRESTCPSGAGGEGRRTRALLLLLLLLFFSPSCARVLPACIQRAIWHAASTMQCTKGCGYTWAQAALLMPPSAPSMI